jgi:hypothetical protein
MKTKVIDNRTKEEFEYKEPKYMGIDGHFGYLIVDVKDRVYLARPTSYSKVLMPVKHLKAVTYNEKD